MPHALSQCLSLIHISRTEGKLANEGFTSKAPANIVEQERRKAERLRELIAKIDESVKALG